MFAYGDEQTHSADTAKHDEKKEQIANFVDATAELLCQGGARYKVAEMGGKKGEKG